MLQLKEILVLALINLALIQLCSGADDIQPAKIGCDDDKCIKCSENTNLVNNLNPKKEKKYTECKTYCGISAFQQAICSGKSCSCSKGLPPPDSPKGFNPIGCDDDKCLKCTLNTDLANNLDQTKPKKYTTCEVHCHTSGSTKPYCNKGACTCFK